MDFPIQLNEIRMGVSIIYFKGSQVEIYQTMMYLRPWGLFLFWKTVQTLMKCRIMRHFIWVFTVFFFKVPGNTKGLEPKLNKQILDI